jgi:hypothetical protein
VTPALGLGGALTAGSVLPPWATRTNAVYREDATPNLHVWSRLPALGVLVLLPGLAAIAAAGWHEWCGRPPPGASPPPAAPSACSSSSPGGMTLVAVATPDLARLRQGFESSRTLPWVGGGVVLSPALVILVTGVVALVEASHAGAGGR